MPISHLQSSDFMETHSRDTINAIIDEVNTLSAGASKEVFIPAEAMNPTTTTPCGALTKVEAVTNSIDYWVLDFDSVIAQSCFFTLRMPDNWDAGVVTFQFIWTTDGGTPGQQIAWSVKGRAYADGDAVDNSYSSEVIVHDPLIGVGEIHLTEESLPLTPAGTLAAGQWAQFRITRRVDDMDDLAADGRLIGLRLKYTTQSL